MPLPVVVVDVVDLTLADDAGRLVAAIPLLATVGMELPPRAVEAVQNLNIERQIATI